MGSDDEQLFWLDGRPKPANETGMSWAVDYIVGPDYLKVMDIALRRGRFFTTQDDEHSPLIAVVDEVFAQKYFPDQDPIGKRIVMNNSGRKTGDRRRRWPQAVGTRSDDTQSLRARFTYRACKCRTTSSRWRRPAWDVARYKGICRRSSTLSAHSRQMSSQQVIFGDQTMESIVADSMPKAIRDDPASAPSQSWLLPWPAWASMA